ncbi:hypothetical protein GQX73_g2447 [Xylaria multiplex]|uniref:SUN domain-containing protein n=1 Tax=Xylaria multiplex TaxID=323545 RepID=A0A7C8MTI6_9PEZI|nr:hypothetical protein GQX73_g2447 [Xylaria multiplex]
MPPKTKKKGSDSSPKKGPGPNPNLPSLFPTHDGSYGINTLVNNSANLGIESEQADDKKWAESMKSKAKMYGMNGNLKKALDESHEEVEKEEHQGQNPSNSSASTDAPSFKPYKPSNSSYPSGSTSSTSFGTSISKSTRPSESTGPSEPPDDCGFIPKLPPYVPEYTNQPFLEEYDSPPQPPYKRVEILSADPYGYGVHQPILPPSEQIPFYGMPQGKGSKQPISPARPNTSRSFNYESGLFSNAGVQGPDQLTGLFGKAPAQPKTQGTPGYKGLFNTGVQPEQITDLWGKAPAQPKSQGTSGYTGLFNTGVQPPTQSSPVQPTVPHSPSYSSTSTGASVYSPTKSTFSEEDPSIQGQHEPAVKPEPTVQPAHVAKVPKAPEIPGPLPAPGKKPAPTTKPAPITKPAPATVSAPVVQAPLVQTPPAQAPNIPDMPVLPMPLTPKSNVSKTKGGQNKFWYKKSQIKDGNRPRIVRWAGLSSSFLIPPLLLLVMILALWGTLRLAPEPNWFDDGDAGIPPVNLRSTEFGFGTLWESISGLLPKASEKSPSSSGFNNIDVDGLVAGLKEEMPESIWVQKDNTGKPKISEDFWHALKEKIQQDDHILSLSNSDISEAHWRAVKSRLQTGGLEVPTNTIDIEPLIEKKISQSWDKWLEQNDQALKEDSTGVALTKDDFMKLFQQEIVSYDREIRQELKALQGRISEITQQVSKLSDEVGSTEIMTKDEIAKVIKSLVSKEVNAAKLDAVAEGVIKGHISDVFANQVNFLGIGAGVLIDPESTSRAWKIPKDHFKSKKWLDKDGYKAQPPMAALSPWSEEGECFCAGPGRMGYGQGTNNISVITSRNIIPQHLVVDHILSGATLDPDATPKEIEVWAYIEEVTLRKEVKSFSEKEFPATPEESALNDGFVKIGHFTYERKNHGDGVQVFKINDAIVRMKAVSNRIVIRAINNYGADHTCFYRLRLFGDIVERLDDSPDHDDNSWFPF